MKLSDRARQKIDLEFDGAKADLIHLLESDEADWTQHHHVQIQVTPEALRGA